MRESGAGYESPISDIVSAAKANMFECDKRMKESRVIPRSIWIEKRVVHTKLQEQFTDWVSARKEKDPNWKFFVNFFFRDILSYLSLFMSTHSGMWKLRMSGIKSMAPTLWHLILPTTKSLFQTICGTLPRCLVI